MVTRLYCFRVLRENIMIRRKQGSQVAGLMVGRKKREQWVSTGGLSSLPNVLTGGLAFWMVSPTFISGLPLSLVPCINYLQKHSHRHSKQCALLISSIALGQQSHSLSCICFFEHVMIFSHPHVFSHCVPSLLDLMPFLKNI